MIAFEKYLLENGYQAWRLEGASFTNNPIHCVEGYKNISSMTNCDNRWFPIGIAPTTENYLKHAFVVGLGEIGHPPYILYPEIADIHKLAVELSPDKLIIELNKKRH